MQKDKNANPKTVPDVDEFIKGYLNSSFLINGVPLFEVTDKAENNVEQQNNERDDNI